MKGDVKTAVRWLNYIRKYDQSAEMRRRLVNDPDFDSIRDSEEFKNILTGFEK
jgi:hypothetical protein